MNISPSVTRTRTSLTATTVNLLKLTFISLNASTPATIRLWVAAPSKALKLGFLSVVILNTKPSISSSVGTGLTV